MLRILNTTDRDFGSQLDALLTRSQSTPDTVVQVVSEILEDVRARGDDAVLALTEKLDGISAGTMADLVLDEAEIESYLQRVEPDLKAAIESAAQRIGAFHERQSQGSWEYTESDGTRLGQKIMRSSQFA